MKLENLFFYLRHPLLIKWRKAGFDPGIYRKFVGQRFQKLGIRTILDVGANAGQSVLMFRSAFPQATIHAIEPLPDCFAQLTRNTVGLSNVHLYNTAVGNASGTIVMEENEYSPSSSVLTMAATHIQHFPYAKDRTPVTVALDTLDNVLADAILLGPMLVNIDVQGYEQAVIEGGNRVLARADVLLVEVSFEELYAGQPLFDDVRTTLSSIGFRYVGAFDQLISPLTGHVLQQDAIFIRK